MNEKIIDNVIVQCPYENGLVSYIKGHGKCNNIEYHEPKGEGDKHYVDVTVENVTTRYFDIKAVTFLEPTHG